jgi:AraC-type DNA-binding domain-containing proteins
MQTLNYKIDMTVESIWDIVTADPFSREHLLYLQEVGLFDSGPEYYTVREGLDSYFINLTLSGQGIMEYEGKTLNVSTGDVIWIDCHSHQKYYTDPAVGKWKSLWIHFYGANSADYYQAYLAASHGSAVTMLHSDNPASELMHSILNIGNNYTSDVLCGIECSSLLTSLVAALIKAASTDRSRNLPTGIMAIRQYMLDNFTEQITLDDLSREFSISKFHLQRQVKKYLGQSPTDYLINVRLTHSKELLRTTELPISEVAFSSGFNNVSYFINLFRRMESVTPQQYRYTWSNSGR